jgi:pimeloyl-ACP methyl ester carboxylesterase
MDEMARDAAALLDQLQVTEALVCGLSMGGYVAFEFRKLFSSRVRALILAGTRAPADNEKEKQVRFEQAERMLVEGMAPIAEATLPKLLAARTLKEKPEVVDSVREMILRTDTTGAAAAQRGMAARRDYSEDFGEIKVPTLIIVGREDSIRPVADSEFMQRGIRNSQLKIIDDAAHMTNVEQAEEFNEAMLGFLKLIH